MKHEILRHYLGAEVRLNKDVANHICPEGRENNSTAKVVATFADHGGLKTDRDLQGCRYWNTADVEFVVPNCMCGSTAGVTLLPGRVNITCTNPECLKTVKGVTLDTALHSWHIQSVKL